MLEHFSQVQNTLPGFLGAFSPDLQDNPSKSQTRSRSVGGVDRRRTVLSTRLRKGVLYPGNAPVVLFTQKQRVTRPDPASRAASWSTRHGVPPLPVPCISSHVSSETHAHHKAYTAFTLMNLYVIRARIPGRSWTHACLLSLYTFSCLWLR